MAKFIENLGDLISVNPGATVSRTVMTSENLRVVLFSFDTGEELSEHTAAMPVFIYVMDGKLDISASGETNRLVPGSFLALTTREPHTVVAVEPTRMVLGMMDPKAS